ncbi:hypothetical protein [Mesorhizobium sp. WSM2239]|uniref:Uncharacterized protein n=2 Tax=unclassified Mesorhizobium TaxID=325217 RepID=A0AAU8DDU4_9HYPH
MDKTLLQIYSKIFYPADMKGEFFDRAGRNADSIHICGREERREADW